MILMERSDRPYIRKPLRGLDRNHRPALRSDENGARRRATAAYLGLLRKTGIGGTFHKIAHIWRIVFPRSGIKIVGADASAARRAEPFLV